MNLIFDVIGCLGVKIRISENHWDLISKRKHPEVLGLERDVQQTIIAPDLIRLSSEDEDVYLYYKKHGKYFLCVVCRHLNGQGFVITCYLTDRVKEGKQIWQK